MSGSLLCNYILRARLDGLVQFPYGGWNVYDAGVILSDSVVLILT